MVAEDKNWHWLEVGHTQDPYCNATKNSQVVIKVSTQNTKKQNKPIDLLPITNDNKLLYKN